MLDFLRRSDDPLPFYYESTGVETFTIAATPGRDLGIVARTPADAPWDVPIFVGGVEAARVRCDASGRAWRECTATVPAAFIRAPQVELAIGTDHGGPRQVAYYWFVQ